ncbi:MAG: hypothetical protein ACJ8AG_18565 [Ktedonobacteraceae bacterium]
MEDPPSPTLPFEEQVAAYRRLRDALTREIRMKLLLPNLLKMVPQRK